MYKAYKKKGTKMKTWNELSGAEQEEIQEMIWQDSIESEIEAQDEVRNYIEERYHRYAD